MARPSGAHGQGTFLLGVHFGWRPHGPSGPLDIVHPVHPLATPLDPTTHRTVSGRSTTELHLVPKTTRVTHSPHLVCASGVTESLFWGGGGQGEWGSRGRHRNERCTIKSQMGGGQWCEWGGDGPPAPPPPIVTPLVCACFKCKK